MELIYPLVLYVGIPVVFVLFLIRFKKKDTYRKGNKVANADFVESNPYYKKLMTQYKIFGSIAIFSLLLSTWASLAMMSRPAKVDTVTHEIRNRDIFICMDISGSVDETNLELVDELRGVVEELDGERFGITIFNAKSVLYIPLTTDYAYIMEMLDELEESFKVSLVMTKYYDGQSLTAEEYEIFYDFDYEKYYYKYAGTLSDEGSSYIGDGLATCLYNFSDLETNPDRARLIIMTTDNELNGTPLLTIEEAAALCSKHDVKVFGIAPDHIMNEQQFKDAILSTGGGYYKTSDKNAYKQLVNDIKATDATIIEKTEILIYDQPEVLFVVLVVLMGIYFGFSRKVKL
ncbi:MAG: hypothetical protein J6A59_18410 [Lachnospiraceae bacterium]|nr:hypothetical protein [Lachnospiraceae bacterium]